MEQDVSNHANSQGGVPKLLPLQGWWLPSSLSHSSSPCPAFLILLSEFFFFLKCWFGCRASAWSGHLHFSLTSPSHHGLWWVKYILIAQLGRFWVIAKNCQSIRFPCSLKNIQTNKFSMGSYWSAEPPISSANKIKKIKKIHHVSSIVSFGAAIFV